MIRQFGFTWTAISWLLMGYGLFFALSPLQAQTAIKKFSPIGKSPNNSASSPDNSKKTYIQSIAYTTRSHERIQLGLTDSDSSEPTDGNSREPAGCDHCGLIVVE